KPSTCKADTDIKTESALEVTKTETQEKELEFEEKPTLPKQKLKSKIDVKKNRGLSIERQNLYESPEFIDIEKPSTGKADTDIKTESALEVTKTETQEKELEFEEKPTLPKQKLKSKIDVKKNRGLSIERQNLYESPEFIDIEKPSTCKADTDIKTESALEVTKTETQEKELEFEEKPTLPKQKLKSKIDVKKNRGLSIERQNLYESPEFIDIEKPSTG
ncbi:putative type IV secretion system protein, partial [Mitosporidium daphniae]